MNFPSKLFLYWNTIRHLKAVQIYGRVWLKLYRPKPDLSEAPPLRKGNTIWTPAVVKQPSISGPSCFRFLNEEHELHSASDWNNKDWDKLWLYNLHYFDDLNAEGSEDRKRLHVALMHRWAAENPPGCGNGWEPYPVSLRVVNWIKWALRGSDLDRGLLQSLAVQARFLRKRLERHLLGNHLFANAKALIFAGLFFSGPEADDWLNEGLAILEREAPEQVLADGGHFERSPMYHAVILEDFLDLINVSSAYTAPFNGRRGELRRNWIKAAHRMLSWLKVMSHPDGEIVLFNDAALGIAAAPAELEAYATLLGMEAVEEESGGLILLAETGCARITEGPAVVFLDVGPCGPDYLLGHAHADTLNFELSLHGRRVIVDTGVSCYGEGPERQRQRSTAAHNTVVIDAHNSSEVWGGFRTARRARPFNLKMTRNEQETVVGCSHDGYRRLPGKPVHRREWRITANGMTIKDTVDGGFSEAIARVHFHPEATVDLSSPECGKIAMPGGNGLAWRIGGGAARIEPSSHHPQFGASLANQCLAVKLHGPELVITFSW